MNNKKYYIAKSQFFTRYIKDYLQYFLYSNINNKN